MTSLKSSTRVPLPSFVSTIMGYDILQHNVLIKIYSSITQNPHKRTDMRNFTQRRVPCRPYNDPCLHGRSNVHRRKKYNITYHFGK